VACVASEPRELAILLDFLTRETTKQRSSQPLLSVMAMGAFGKISRLLFAKTGSVLNYGFLDQSNASGQWPAKLLKKRLAELTDG
jgi:3-dehydroquinate dehydratase